MARLASAKIAFDRHYTTERVMYLHRAPAIPSSRSNSFMLIDTIDILEWSTGCVQLASASGLRSFPLQGSAKGGLRSFTGARPGREVAPKPAVRRGAGTRRDRDPQRPLTACVDGLFTSGPSHYSQVRRRRCHVPFLKPREPNI